MVKAFVILFLAVSLSFSQRDALPQFSNGFQQFDQVDQIFDGVLKSPKIKTQKNFIWTGESGEYFSFICIRCPRRDIKLYSTDNNRLITHFQDSVNDDVFILNSSNFFRGIPLKLEHRGEYRIEFKGEGRYSGKVFIAKESEFRRYEHQKLKNLLWYISILVVFIWVNAILAFTTNHPSSRYYMGYLIFYVMTIFFYSELSTYFFKDFSSWLNLRVFSFFYLSLAFLLKFVQSLLDSKRTKRINQNVVNVLYGLVILSFLPIDIWIPSFFDIMAMLAVLYIFLMATWETTRSPKYDLNFISVALGFFLLGNIIALMNNIGIFDGSLNQNRYLITTTGSLLEVLILTIYIAFKAHREKARNLEIVQEQEQFRIELMRNIAHELRTPLVGLTGVAEEHQDQERLDQISKLLHHIHQVDPRMRGRDDA